MSLLALLEKTNVGEWIGFKIEFLPFFPMN
jgi:hypothetical protein